MMRIGVLGGSFNPAHAGHRQIAEAFRTRLHLHQVWLLVSPGNPLKPGPDMAPFARRLASARAVANPPQVVATGIEAALGTRFTADTMHVLQRRFPRARFVWLMGADIWTQLPRWRRWRYLTTMVPMAVHARPGANRAALVGQASRALRARRQKASAAGSLANRAAPAWLFLDLPQCDLSATALREAGLGLQPPIMTPSPPPNRSAP